jgi:hypothetical protein
VRNLRRGHYDIATDVSDRHRHRIAFDDLAMTITGRSAGRDAQDLRPSKPWLEHATIGESAAKGTTGNSHEPTSGGVRRQGPQGSAPRGNDDLSMLRRGAVADA